MSATRIRVTVLQTVVQRTGSHGSATDASNIHTYLGDPQGASFSLLGAVDGIPLSHFFANSTQAFDALRHSLWQDIAQALNPLLPEPEWDVDTPIGQLVAYIGLNTP